MSEEIINEEIHEEINLEERDVYRSDMDKVSHLINVIENVVPKPKESSKSLKEIKKKMAKYTNIIYCIVISMLIIMLFNFMVTNLTTANKLAMHVVRVIIHVIGLSVCEKAEYSLNEHETKKFIKEAKDTASQLQKLLEENIKSILLMHDDIFKAANKVIIKAGSISECDNPYIARLLVSLFRNGAFFASFMVCCLNLFVVAAIAMCQTMASLQFLEFFEQLETVLLYAAYVLITDIGIQAFTLYRIKRGCLISNQISYWIEKLDEFDREVFLLHENLRLFRNFQPRI